MPVTEMDFRRLEAKFDRLTEMVLNETVGVREAAKILGIGEREVRKRCNNGRLSPIPGTRPYRFFKSEIMKR